MTANSVAAAIVAGGRGLRLGGMVKPLLMIKGQTILDRQVQALSKVFARVMLVVADAGPFVDIARDLGVDVVTDRVPAGLGPLAGIDAALAALRAEEGAVFCVAGDMPFLQVPLLQLMRDHAPTSLVVAARVGAHPEPLFARYGRGAAAIVSQRLREKELKAADLLTALDADFVGEALLQAQDPGLRSLRNVNGPEDLAAAQAEC